MKKLCLTILIILSSMNISFSCDSRCIKFTDDGFSSERTLIEKIHKIKQLPRIKTSIFVSNYDLNGDGISEYFSYIDSFGYCGNKTGCYINVYRYEDGKLIRITRRGIPTLFKFLPNLNDKECFVHVLSEKNNGWDQISIGGRILHFDGNEYKY